MNMQPNNNQRVENLLLLNLSDLVRHPKVKAFVQMLVGFATLAAISETGGSIAVSETGLTINVNRPH